MASRIAQVVIAAVNPEVIFRFWCDVLVWAELDREGDDSRVAVAGALPDRSVSSIRFMFAMKMSVN